MRTISSSGRRVYAVSGYLILCSVALFSVALTTRDSKAALFLFRRSNQACNSHACETQGCSSGVHLTGEPGATWYWLRSPDEEKRVVIGLYNRYCIRCHGVDGRGVWDIPGVPNFTNVRWQQCRTDAQLANIIMQGRGAVMPPFRGVLSLEEAWAVARYLRTFVPGTEMSRPDFGATDKGKSSK